MQRSVALFWLYCSFDMVMIKISWDMWCLVSLQYLITHWFFAHAGCGRWFNMSDFAIGVKQQCTQLNWIIVLGLNKCSDLVFSFRILLSAISQNLFDLGEKSYSPLKWEMWKCSLKFGKEFIGAMSKHSSLILAYLQHI